MSQIKESDISRTLQSHGFATSQAGLKTPLGDDSGHSAIVSGELDAQQSLAGEGNAADTTMDTLFSKALNAGLLANDGDAIEVEAWGTTAANGNNKKAQIKFGATVVADTGTITSNNKAWHARAVIVRQDASKQVATGHTYADTAVSTTNSKPTEDETGSITVEVLGGSTTTGAASDILCNGFRITARPAA